MKGIVCLLFLPLLVWADSSLFSEADNDAARLQQSQVQRLTHLSPFSDIVVIQRRYQPKTGRFEFSLSSLLILSSEFFINTGVGGSLGFYLLEKHGLEIRGFYAIQLERGVYRDLRGVEVGAQISGDRTESFAGLVYKWVPVYGKMAWFNEKIISFDTYIAVGGGVSRVLCSPNVDSKNKVQSPGGGSEFANLGVCTPVRRGQTIQEKKWEPTSFIGLGQSFSLSKSLSFRLDFAHQYYGVFTQNKHHSDFLISFSISYYFPEASKR